MSIKEILIWIETQQNELNFLLAQLFVDTFYTNSAKFWFFMPVMLVAIFFIAVRMRRFCLIEDEERPTLWVKVVRLFLGTVPFFILLSSFFAIGFGSGLGWDWISKHRPGVYWNFKEIVFPLASDILPWGAGTGLVIGSLAYVIIGRWLEPWFSESQALGGRKINFETITTSKEAVDFLSLFEKKFKKSVDLEKRLKDAHKKDLLYAGVDESGSSVGFSRRSWCESGTQLIGPMGSGKGVAAGVLFSQSIRYWNDAVIVFDPKGDSWLPSVLRLACKLAGKSFDYVDLTAEVPQINLFQGLSPREVQSLLESGLALADSGERATDHYAAIDRSHMKTLVSAGCRSFAEMSERAEEILQLAEGEAKSFLEKLSDLAKISAIQTDNGLDLERVIRDGGCLYIRGDDFDEPIIKLQKMIFTRMLMSIRRRQDASDERHVTFFLDELKYIISRVSVNAMGTIRSRGANLVLAHQTLADLESYQGGDLDGQVLKKSVLSLTSNRLIYVAADYETGEWVAEQTGTKRVYQNVQQVERNDLNADLIHSDRQIRESEGAFIPISVIRALPPSVGIVIAQGELAKLAFCKPILTDRSEITVIPAPQIDFDKFSPLPDFRVSNINNNEKGSLI